MSRAIYLPILDSLTVKNYPLYPGKEGQGLELEFRDGVTVLAGINGIGKTTLLNLLLRMIIGPTDPVKADRELGRVSRRVLTMPVKRDFFSARVPQALQANAKATLTFRLGDRNLSVSRSLRDMSLLAITVNGRKQRIPEEQAFIEELAKWAGVSSAYDFHIIVRYLQFFAEERLPILWSPGTQFEFFKILYFDRELQDRLNTTFARIQRIDTSYRNRRHQLNKRIERNPKPESDQDIPVETLLKMVAEAQAAFERADAAYDNAGEIYQVQRQRAFDAYDAISRAEVSLTDAEANFIAADSHFIAHALPNLDDKLKFLMQGIGGGQGCFVCGNRNSKSARAIGKELLQGNCFVCHSSLSADQIKLKPLSADKVRAVESEVEAAHTELHNAKLRRDAAEADLKAAGLELQEASSLRRTTQQQLEELRRHLPADGSLAGTENGIIEAEKKALLELELQRNQLVEEYREAITEGQTKMASLTEDLRRSFTRYAEAFLMEEVNVDISRQSPFRPATGAKAVNIPTFTVKMTSSTFKQPEARSSADSVSESQKEFLDLAFRMAMIDLLAAKASITLVVETPEASLDSYFMRRAADLMRSFTTHQESASRRLIATSNLNGTKMIPALLGILAKDWSILSNRPADAGHLVNLMELTARAKVLDVPEASDLLLNEIQEYIQ